MYSKKATFLYIVKRDTNNLAFFLFRCTLCGTAEITKFSYFTQYFMYILFLCSNNIHRIYYTLYSYDIVHTDKPNLYIFIHK